MSDAPQPGDLLLLTADVVAAYVGKNPVPVGDLPSLLRQVYDALAALDKPIPAEAPAAFRPAVAIGKSVTPDFIVCLEDGRKLKMLKRHLRTAYGLSPAEYRHKWGLGADYPMVAPNYAKLRSALAKEIGLGSAEPGRKRR